jgi:hypothetical protein
MRYANALSGFIRKSTESVSDFAGVVRNLIMDVRDSYGQNCITCVAPTRNGTPSIGPG